MCLDFASPYLLKGLNSSVAEGNNVSKLKDKLIV